MSKLNKLFLITSVVAGLGHFRAGRHFSDKGEVLSHDALTEAQWDQVKKDPRLVVTEAEPDKETAQALRAVDASAQGGVSDKQESINESVAGVQAKALVEAENDIKPAGEVKADAVNTDKDTKAVDAPVVKVKTPTKAK